MLRNVQPELLDTLPPDAAAARASRRDLRWINLLMGNFGWMEARVGELGCRERRLLEIGAGDGVLARRLQARFNLTDYSAIDWAPQPAHWPAPAVWLTGDLLTAPALDSAEVLLANLILHHFTDLQLQQFGQRIQRSGVRHILANEPCRRRWHKAQLLAGRLIGFNGVTWHDGCVSIDAGFRQQELPALLGLRESEWQIDCQESWLGGYRMEARRR